MSSSITFAAGQRWGKQFAASIVEGQNKADRDRWTPDLRKAFEDVAVEVKAAYRKHGHHEEYPNRIPMEWHGILAEEYGEVSKEIVEAHWGNPNYENMVVELAQTAAMCVATMAWLRWKGLAS